MKTKLMALEVLKNSRKELHACQAVIHLAGGFDPEYVRGAQAAMKNMDEAIAALEADIAKPGEPYGWTVSGTGRVYFSEHAEDDAKQEANLCGGSTRVFPLYTTPQEPAAMWMPIETAPKDGAIIDLWRSSNGGERCTEMRRVDLGSGNVFYEPVHSGYSCVRDATHWMPLPAAPELLDELENCVDLLATCFPDAPVDSCIGVGIIKARAAIAKATGATL